MPRSSARLRNIRLLTGAVTGVAMLMAAGCSATAENSEQDAPAAARSATIPAKDGPGVTAQTITVSWGKALMPVPGGEPAQMAKNRREALKAVVDAFNEQGGIGGRDIRILEKDPGAALVKQRAEAYEKSNFLPVPDPSKGKAACDAYADSGAFALLYPNLASAPYGTPAAGACLNSGGRPVIGVTDWTAADYRAAPSTAGLSIAADRLDDALVAAGKDSGVLKNPAKTALITDSTQPSGLVEKTYLPALAKAGVTDPQVFPASATMSPADTLSLAVKLKSAGIQRVVITAGAESSFGLLYTLLPVFQKQQLEPQILSIDGPPTQALTASGQIKATPTLNDNLVTYLSRPTRDTQKLTEAQSATPGGKLYNAVVKANPTLQPYLDLDLCDGLELLKAALAASGSTHVNAEAFAAGLDKLGTTYQSPRLYATAFGPDRRDGGAGLVRQRYSASCKCSVPDTKVLDF